MVYLANILQGYFTGTGKIIDGYKTVISPMHQQWKLNEMLCLRPHVYSVKLNQLGIPRDYMQCVKQDPVLDQSSVEHMT